MQQRNLAVDLARAIAIFAMIVVNFKVVMQAQDGPTWLVNITNLLEGRASALFVVLAGY